MDRRRFVYAAATLPLGAVVGAAAAAQETPMWTPHYLETAKELITAWRRKDIDATLSHVADDIVWYSHVGSPPTIGKAAMREVLVKFAASMNEVRWRIFDSAQNGNRLFLEGVDDFITPDGRRVVVPYAGVLVFRENLVAEWRDYFDRTYVDKLRAGETAPAHIATLTAREALF